MEDPERAFGSLLRELARLFRAEGRPGGDAVAEVLEAASAAPPPLRPEPPYRLDGEIRRALVRARHPAARAARAAHPVLAWRATGVPAERIAGSVADLFAVVPLIGPGAAIEADGLRSGLFMQVAGAYYPLHAHAAEETYVMLAGEGRWTLGAGRPVRRRSGDYIHHPSGAGHATRTGPRPLVAAYRWSGDIGFESYRLTGE